MAKSSDAYVHQLVLRVPSAALNGYRGFASDAGGTLLKVVYTEDDPETGEVLLHLDTMVNQDMATALKFLKENVIPMRDQIGEKFIVRAAGWGNKVAENQYREMFGLVPEFVDEFYSYGYGFYHLMDIIGPDRLLHNIITCPAKEKWGTMEYLRDIMVKERSREHRPKSRDLYPTLVAFIGSGIGFTKIEADGTCSDIHLGSLTGGMFFWGVGRVLTQAESFDQLMAMVEAGNAANVCDVLSDVPSGVSYDIYEFDFLKEAFSHLGETVLLPFGKLGRGEVTEVSKEDMAVSLLHTICFQIMEQALLFARWHNVRSIFFCGSFVRNNKIFSDYVQRAPFFDMKMTGPELIVGQLQYEGYISALGCFLQAARKKSTS